MKERYISIKEATERLGVARGTMRYYLDKLEIGKKKFPLDKHQYILYADFERIRQYRQEAIERGEQTVELPAMPKEDAA